MSKLNISMVILLKLCFLLSLDKMQNLENEIQREYYLCHFNFAFLTSYVQIAMINLWCKYLNYLTFSFVLIKCFDMRILKRYR